MISDRAQLQIGLFFRVYYHRIVRECVQVHSGFIYHCISLSNEGVGDRADISGDSISISAGASA